MTEQFSLDQVQPEKPAEFIQEGNFHPVGILRHQYYPIELVGISELGNDLEYIVTYWAIDRLWKSHLVVKRFERVLTTLLSERPVIADYRDMNGLKLLIPRVAKPLGFEKIYQENLNTLRDLDKEQLDEFMRQRDDETLLRLGDPSIRNICSVLQDRLCCCRRWPLGYPGLRKDVRGQITIYRLLHERHCWLREIERNPAPALGPTRYASVLSRSQADMRKGGMMHVLELLSPHRPYV
jgi:hypothetical protein